MADDSLVFELLAVDKASEVVRKVSESFADADTKMQKAAKVSGAALAAGGAAAIAFGSRAVMAASDLSETTSKIQVLFGDQASAIQKWSDTTATAIGQSKQSALDAAADFATFGKAAGLQGPQLTGFSTGLTQLASDMASFSNTSPEEAIDAIGSALRGEAEPIRKYGVLLDEATLQNAALKAGIISSTKQALTPAQKVLAAQAAIMAQTTAAQGDFARTSSGAANQQRILAADIADLSAKAGQVLLPALKAAVTVLVAVVSIVQQHTTVFGVLGATLAVVAATIWSVNAAQNAWAVGSKIVAGATKAWAAVQWLLNAALTANPIGLVVVGIAALIAGVILAYKHSAKFRAVVQGAMAGAAAAFRFLWGAAKAVFGWVRDHWVLIASILGGPIVAAAIYIVRNFDKIKQGITSRIDAVVGFLHGLPSRIKASLGRLGALLLSAGRDIVGGLLKGIRDSASGIVTTIKNYITDRIPAAVRKFMDIRSPSRVMRKLGRFTGLGYALGIADTRRDAERAMHHVLGATTGVRGPALAGSSAPTARARFGGLGPTAGSASGAAAPIVLQVTVQTLNPTPQVGRAVVDSIEAHLARGGRVSPRLRAAVR